MGKNLFMEKTDKELVVLYGQFLKSEKEMGIPDNELGKIRDRYLEMHNPNGVLMMILDLTRTISDRWYGDKIAKDCIEKYNRMTILFL